MRAKCRLIHNVALLGGCPCARSFVRNTVELRWKSGVSQSRVYNPMKKHISPVRSFLPRSVPEFWTLSIKMSFVTIIQGSMNFDPMTRYNLGQERG